MTNTQTIFDRPNKDPRRARSALYAGLGLQIIGLTALTQLSPSWSVTASLAFVMALQGLSDVAKYLAKMSSKSAVNLLAPAEDGALFRWVSILTGSKNAVKGFGFLLGASLLAIFGFTTSLLSVAVVLAATLAAPFYFMPPGLPGGMKGVKFSSVSQRTHRSIDCL